MLKCAMLGAFTVCTNLRLSSFAQPYAPAIIEVHFIVFFLNSSLNSLSKTQAYAPEDVLQRLLLPIYIQITLFQNN